MKATGSGERPRALLAGLGPWKLSAFAIIGAVIVVVLSVGYNSLREAGIFVPSPTLNPNPTPALLGDPTGYRASEASGPSIGRSLTVDPDGVHATLTFGGGPEADTPCAVQYRPVGYVSGGEIYVGIVEMPSDVHVNCGGVNNVRTLRLLLPEPISGSNWHVLEPPGSHF